MSEPDIFPSSQAPVASDLVPNFPVPDSVLVTYNCSDVDDFKRTYPLGTMQLPKDKNNHNDEAPVIVTVLILVFIYNKNIKKN